MDQVHDMPAFRALSFGDKWRVGQSLRRGEAPKDPEMAAAAVEWAESYRLQSRSRTALLRWLPLAVVIACGAAAILFAIEGDAPVAILNGLIVLANLAHLAFNPVVRPKSVARCLEASKRVAASSSHEIP